MCVVQPIYNIYVVGLGAGPGRWVQLWQAPQAANAVAGAEAMPTRVVEAWPAARRKTIRQNPPGATWAHRPGGVVCWCWRSRVSAFAACGARQNPVVQNPPGATWRWGGAGVAPDARWCSWLLRVAPGGAGRRGRWPAVALGLLRVALGWRRCGAGVAQNPWRKKCLTPPPPVA